MRVLILLLVLAVAACTAPSSPSAEQEKLLKLADEKLAATDVDTALALLHQAASASEGDVQAHKKLVALYVQQKNPELALPVMDDAIRLQPKNASLYSAKGKLLDLTGQHEEAQPEYAKALQLTPDSLTASNNLAYSLLASGKTKEAITILEPFVTQSTAPDQIRYNLALAYGMNGEPQKATALLQDKISAQELAQNQKAYAYYRKKPQALFPSTTHPIVMDDSQAAPPFQVEGLWEKD